VKWMTDEPRLPGPAWNAAPITLRLRCIIGDHAFDWQSRGEITLGRGSGNTLSFSDRSVSRIHARIENLGRRYRIWDLHSVNGIRVNGQKVPSYTLEKGDEILLGGVRLRVL